MTTMENLIYTQEYTLMKSIIIYKLFEIRQHLPIQVRDIFILVLHILSAMIQYLSSQLLKLSARDIKIFANAVKVLDTRLIPASSVARNTYHQVLEYIWISSTPFMENNQMKHQESGTSILQQVTSNPGPLLPTPALWFQISWGGLIIIPLIMVMLRFTLHIYQLNLTLNLFQIQTPLQLNQLMMTKCIISWNSSTHNMMIIFWMYTSICFSLDWLSPLLQNFIQYLLCCFINMEELMLHSQIACHTFFVCTNQGYCETV